MKIKTTPEYGVSRTRKKFLWLPQKFYIIEKRETGNKEGATHITKCWGKTETLWLETIEIDEEWKEGGAPEGVDYWQMTDYRRLNFAFRNESD
jgi:hypothetical protein